MKSLLKIDEDGDKEVKEREEGWRDEKGRGRRGRERERAKDHFFSHFLTQLLSLYLSLSLFISLSVFISLCLYLSLFISLSVLISLSLGTQVSDPGVSR